MSAISVTSRGGAITARGGWLPATPYYQDDVVVWLGAEYQSLLPYNIGNQPDLTPNAWIFANQGVQTGVVTPGQIILSDTGWNPLTDPPPGLTTPTTARLFIGGHYTDAGGGGIFYHWGEMVYMTNPNSAPMTGVQTKVTGFQPRGLGTSVRQIGDRIEVTQAGNGGAITNAAVNMHIAGAFTGTPTFPITFQWNDGTAEIATMTNLVGSTATIVRGGGATAHNDGVGLTFTGLPVARTPDAHSTEILVGQTSAQGSGTAAQGSNTLTAFTVTQPGSQFAVGMTVRNWTLFSGAATNGHTLTDIANAPFRAGDVGKNIKVDSAVLGNDVMTTITGFTSASQVIVAATLDVIAGGVSYHFSQGIPQGTTITQVNGTPIPTIAQMAAPSTLTLSNNVDVGVGWAGGSLAIQCNGQIHTTIGLLITGLGLSGSEGGLGNPDGTAIHIEAQGLSQFANGLSFGGSSLLPTGQGIFFNGVTADKLIMADSGSNATNFALLEGTYSGGAISMSQVTAPEGLTFGASCVFSVAAINLPGHNIATDGVTGTKIGTSASQRLGLWNTTPVAQQTVTGDKHNLPILQSLMSALALPGFVADTTTNTSYAPQLFTTNGTATVPPGVTQARITSVGGGGAGGGGGSNAGAVAASPGGGGGAGGTVTKIVNLGANTSLSVTVGAGGTGGAGGSSGAGTTGGQGGSSTITGTGISVTAFGGSPGKGGATVVTTQSAGGIMGLIGSNSSGTTIASLPGAGGWTNTSGTPTAGGGPIASTGGGGGAGGSSSATNGGGAGGQGTAAAGGAAGGVGTSGTTAGVSNSTSPTTSGTGGGGGGGGGGVSAAAGGSGGGGDSGSVTIEWMQV